MSLVEAAILRRKREDNEAKRPKEARCDKCGRRTRDRTGTCQLCRLGRGPDLSRLPLGTASIANITTLIAACRAELQRRKAEVEKALEGA